ncbi:hypothetical protein UWK_01049 [Desulfocapsa sulfexigens DSM 10523]|uniref:Uncharacterized protein n=1 Tax=Desulfocapsa sulfexigens (strain DSM 10523 / SB164P1) TaxID=1167006 RepID=M1PMF5_DESSD|nr:hypothetical protein [Desulfocapsa sulfexigens]AGF77621.1 hypothetical protein UWK_01049 [Desulfocapsa sulfexigens DSM 10523]
MSPVGVPTEIANKLETLFGDVLGESRYALLVSPSFTNSLRRLALNNSASAHLKTKIEKNNIFGN